MTGDKLVQVEILWRKGNYLARVAGEHPRYGVAVEFETGTPVKSRGVLKFNLAPGFYRVRESGKVRYIRVDRLQAEDIPGDLDPWIAKAATGPMPGEPGEWYGKVCACGERAEWYDPDGFPECDGCAGKVAV